MRDKKTQPAVARSLYGHLTLSKTSHDLLTDAESSTTWIFSLKEVFLHCYQFAVKYILKPSENEQVILIMNMFCHVKVNILSKLLLTTFIFLRMCLFQTVTSVG